jgi:hypothetical protein
MIRESLQSPEEQKLIDFVTDENFLKNGKVGLHSLFTKDEVGDLTDKFESIERSKILIL